MQDQTIRLAVDLLSGGGMKPVTLYFLPRTWIGKWIHDVRDIRHADPSPYEITGLPRCYGGSELVWAVDRMVVSITNEQGTHVFTSDRVIAVSGPVTETIVAGDVIMHVAQPEIYDT
jgi:hypothetical protein